MKHVEFEKVRPRPPIMEKTYLESNPNFSFLSGERPFLANRVRSKASSSRSTNFYPRTQSTHEASDETSMCRLYWHSQKRKNCPCRQVVFCTTIYYGVSCPSVCKSVAEPVVLKYLKSLLENLSWWTHNKMFQLNNYYR